MIQVERLWDRLMKLGELGKQPSGGVTRFSFTEEEQQAKRLVVSYGRGGHACQGRCGRKSDWTA